MMRSFPRHRSPRSMTIVFSLSLLAGCGAVGPAHTTLSIADPPANVVDITQDQFAPFILVAPPGGAIMWHNHDHVSHTIAATPEHQSYLNAVPLALAVPPGGMVTARLMQPGLYHYYDSTVSDWSDRFARVTPRVGKADFPLTMEGMIFVPGSIPNLPDAATNAILFQHDEIVKNILAIHTGGTVSWHNYDTDAHFLLPVLGWDAPINPIDIGINNLLGSDAAPPDGQTRSITFTTPGLYYYYCYNHAVINPVLLRAYAKPMASEYPIPMEGWVLVADG